MAAPLQPGRVIKIESVSDTIRRFWIEVPGVKTFHFKPGQFVTLDLPIHEQPAKRMRSYSIASCPDGSNIFELVIVLLDMGAGTNYIFHNWKEGSEISFRGPLGVFTLPETIEKDLFLICTGTGIAPFRSMVHYIHKHSLPTEDIYLIFGCRTLKYCLYGEELIQLNQKMEKFRYIPTFSREPAGNEYRTGYVHNVYEEILRQSDNNKEAQFFLCGWKEMINEAKQRIMDLGFDRKSIHQELYG